MKHKLKITILILAMFVITQFIGLYVVNYYSPVHVVDGNSVNVSAPSLPYGMETPQPTQSEFWTILPSLIFAFIIAILILLLLSKIKANIVLKIWFFVVVVLALGISFNSFIPSTIKYSSLIALAIALPLAILKIFKRNFLIHNLTELFIYPGVAAIFVSILNIWTIIVLLIIISIYDMWAVWHSGIMQKMAKYQMNELKIFSGFFVPYISQKVRAQIKKLSKSQLKKKKIKTNVAILGGGDVVFPIIASGVVLKTLGLIPALFVILGATLGLTYLLFAAEKKKFYPAMPFITTGIFIFLFISYLIFVL